MIERDGARIAELEAENARLLEHQERGTAALRTAFGDELWRLGHPAYVIVHLRDELAKLDRQWKLARVELDEARAALAEAQRDAERYRLMRRNPTVDGESLVVVEVLEFNEDGPTDVYYAYAGDPLDAAIDAAIAKEQSHASE